MYVCVRVGELVRVCHVVNGVAHMLTYHMCTRTSPYISHPLPFLCKHDGMRRNTVRLSTYTPSCTLAPDLVERTSRSQAEVNHSWNRTCLTAFASHSSITFSQRSADFHQCAPTDPVHGVQSGVRPALSVIEWPPRWPDWNCCWRPFA